MRLTAAAFAATAEFTRQLRLRAFSGQEATIAHSVENLRRRGDLPAQLLYV